MQTVSIVGGCYQTAGTVALTDAIFFTIIQHFLFFFFDTDQEVRAGMTG